MCLYADSAAVQDNPGNVSSPESCGEANPPLIRIQQQAGAGYATAAGVKVMERLQKLISVRAGAMLCAALVAVSLGGCVTHRPYYTHASVGYGNLDHYGHDSLYQREYELECSRYTERMRHEHLQYEEERERRLQAIRHANARDRLRLEREKLAWEREYAKRREAHQKNLAQLQRNHERKQQEYRKREQEKRRQDQPRQAQHRLDQSGKSANNLNAAQPNRPAFTPPAGREKEQSQRREEHRKNVAQQQREQERKEQEYREREQERSRQERSDKPVFKSSSDSEKNRERGAGNRQRDRSESPERQREGFGRSQRHSR